MQNDLENDGACFLCLATLAFPLFGNSSVELELFCSHGLWEANNVEGKGSCGGALPA